MLKKYVSKFAMDILPSVIATIIGAYIVNHYIVTKPGADAPVAAAVASADPKAEARIAPEAANSKAPETSADVATIPEPGVKAKGISEKAMLERSAVEKPQEKVQDGAGAKSADRPVETASIPVDTRRNQPATREKTVARTVTASPPQPSVPAVVPVVAAPVPAPPVEAAIAPQERRDANDLARAAIERLRGTNDGSPRSQEAARGSNPAAPARIPDAAHSPDAPRVSAPAVRPLPPPIMVSAPSREMIDAAPGSPQMKPPYAAAARTDDPDRPTPPADIPFSRPLDLHAEAAEPVREHTTVAEDMLLAAKSVFHAVLPK